MLHPLQAGPHTEGLPWTGRRDRVIGLMQASRPLQLASDLCKLK